MAPLRFLAFAFLVSVRFFFCLFCFVFFFSEIALGNLYLPWLPRLVAKFEQILSERFGNILKQGFKGHKNSE